MPEISRNRQNARYAEDVVNVKDFGAKGDGVTDDTAAILAADQSGAKKIIFPAGNYRVTQSISKTLGVDWIGEGFHQGAQSPQQSATKITVDTLASGNFIHIDGVTPGVGEANLKIEGIAFIAIGASKDTITGIDVEIKIFTLRNCSLTDFSVGIKHNSVETWIENNYFSSCGVCIDSAGGESHITNNHGFPETTAIQVRGSGTIVKGNKFFGDGSSGDFGIIVWGRGNIISNNVMDAFTDAGILLRSNTGGLDANSNIISNNNVSGIGNGGTFDSGIVFDVTNANMNDNIIANNVIFNKRGDRVTINGFDVNVAAGRTFDRNLFIGNSISDLTGSPIVYSGSGTRSNNMYRSNTGDAPILDKTNGVTAGYNGLTVNHGLGFTPDHISVTPESNNVYACSVDTINSTSFRLLMRDNTGALITSGSPVNVNWMCFHNLT